MKKPTLILLLSVTMGGAEKRISRYFLHLSKLGHPLYLLTTERLAEMLAAQGTDLRDCPNVLLARGAGQSFGDRLIPRFWFLLRTTFQCLRFIRKHAIQRVHFTISSPYMNYLIAQYPGLEYGRSFFTNTLDLDFNHGFPKWVFKRLIARSHFIDFLSPDIHESFLRTYPRLCRAEKIHIAPTSFTDYRVYTPAAIKHNVVASISRLVPGKNLDLLLQAAAIVIERVRTSVADLRFEIGGKGALEPELKRMAKDLRIDSRVSFSYVDRPEQLLGKSKVFVSLQEITNYPSQSVLEAMACENAIVATDVGSTRTLVDETVGVLVPFSANEIAETIVKLLLDEPLRKKLGRNARERVMRDFTIELYCEYLLDGIYKD